MTLTAAWTYNPRGEIVTEVHRDATGAERPCKEGYSRLVREFTPYGRLVQETFSGYAAEQGFAVDASTDSLVLEDDPDSLRYDRTRLLFASDEFVLVALTRPDLFTPDGFNAALMIVRAIQRGGGDNVDRMISALEGWQFVGPKGINRIRQQDHALLQPMYQVRLRTVNGRPQAIPVKTFSPGNLQPPVTPFK